MAYWLGLMVLFACQTQPAVSEPDPVPAAQPQPAPEPPSPTDIHDMDPALSASIEAAEVAFVGEILTIDQAPNAWSGVLAIYQPVTYRVEVGLKGAEAAQEITVQHPLVMGSVTAAKRTPGLAPELFKVGASLTVFARHQGEQLVCLSETTGVLAATDAHRAAN